MNPLETVANLPLWVQILSGLGFPTLLMSVVLGVGKVLERRRARAAALLDKQSGREEREEERQERWNAAFRQNAEKHLPWDGQVMGRVQQHEWLINDLREKAGLPRVEFPPLPDPPPLFPDFPPVA